MGMTTNAKARSALKSPPHIAEGFLLERWIWYFYLFSALVPGSFLVTRKLQITSSAFKS